MLQRLGDEYSYPNVDRRKSVRYEFSVGIEIEWCSKKYCGRVRNLSRHGTFIELPGLSALTLLKLGRTTIETRQPLMVNLHLVPRHVAFRIAKRLNLPDRETPVA